MVGLTKIVKGDKVVEGGGQEERKALSGEKLLSGLLRISAG